MPSLSQRIKKVAIECGAVLVGITTKKRLLNAPPSGNPDDLLPSARSVISFAIALDHEAARSFISKKDWLSHCENRKIVVKNLYSISDHLAALLRAEGFEALSVDINNNYRPENGAADITEMTDFYPEFAHRYAAVAAGIGRLGWSGNLMTSEYGALVELGSVLTSAELEPDPLLLDSPCDKCKMCALVCPVGMVHPKESTVVTIAGLTEEISDKRPNTCCWIGCTGYESHSPGATWSNWSPYRLSRPLPEEKGAIDALCIQLQKADPQMQDAENSFSDYRKAVFDEDWLYYTVCGFCRTVCWPGREDRKKNRDLITSSGTAALSLNGMHIPAGSETAQILTPFGVEVVVSKAELDQLNEEKHSDGKAPGYSPLDRETIKFLRERNK